MRAAVAPRTARAVADLLPSHRRGLGRALGGEALEPGRVRNDALAASTVRDVAVLHHRHVEGRAHLPLPSGDALGLAATISVEALHRSTNGRGATAGPMGRVRRGP